jgi:hypothetical protein
MNISAISLYPDDSSLAKLATLTPTGEFVSIAIESVLLIFAILRCTNAKSTGNGGLLYRISNFLDNSKQKEDISALLSIMDVTLCQASLYISSTNTNCKDKRQVV